MKKAPCSLRVLKKLFFNMWLPFDNILKNKILTVCLRNWTRTVNALNVLHNSFIERRATRSRQREHIRNFMPCVVFPWSLIDKENLRLKDQERKNEAEYQKEEQSVKKYQPVRAEIFFERCLLVKMQNVL